MTDSVFLQDGARFGKDAKPVYILTQTDLEPDDWQYCVGMFLSVRDYFSDEAGKLDAAALKKNFQWDILVTEWGCTPAKAAWFKNELLEAMGKQDPAFASALKDMLEEGKINVCPGSTVHAIGHDIEDSQKLIMQTILLKSGITATASSSGLTAENRQAIADRLLAASRSHDTSVTIDIISPPKDVFDVMQAYLQEGGRADQLPRARMYGSFNLNEVKKVPAIMRQFQALADEGVSFLLYDRSANLGKAGYSKDITTNTTHAASALLAQHLEDSASPLAQMVIERSREWNKAILYYKMSGSFEKAAESMPGSSNPEAFAGAFGTLESFMKDFETTDLQKTAQRFVDFFEKAFDRQALAQTAQAGNANAAKAQERLSQVENMAKNPGQVCFADQLLLLPDAYFAPGGHMALSQENGKFSVQDSASATPFAKHGKATGGLKIYARLAKLVLKEDEYGRFIADMAALEPAPGPQKAMTARL